MFLPKSQARFIQNVSLSVRPGSTLGIVGEAGAGKSALARIMIGHERPEQGRVLFMGNDINTLSKAERLWVGARLRMLGQARLGAMARKTVATYMAEPLLQGDARATVESQVIDALRLVGLSHLDQDKYPSALTGGEQMRLAAAHIIVTKPRLVIIDEPAWDMDVSVQFQMLNMFLELADKLDLTLVVISSNLSVAETLCDELVILKEGRVVESGSTRRVLTAPSQDYTRGLIRRQNAGQSTAARGGSNPQNPPLVNTF